MTRTLWTLAGLSAIALSALSAAAQDASKPTAPAGPKHTLRYKFKPGETIRWQVEQRMDVATTVNGNTQNAELSTTSVKIWQVKEVAADGAATFENSAEDVEMRQKLTGRAEIHYSSKSDKAPPVGFETVAKSIGVPLSRVVMDPLGKIVKREHLTGANQEGQVALPLPEQPVAVGETWSFPADITVPLPDNMAKQVKTQQQFTLEEVKGDIATIRVTTQILTPIDNPAVETQVVQRETSGKLKFDIAQGRIVSQKLEADKKVYGFSGAASVYHYKNSFTEKLLAGEPKAEAPAEKSADAPKAAAKTPDVSEVPKPEESAPQTAERPNETREF